MIELNLSNSDNPEKHINESIHLLKLIDDEAAKNNKLIINMKNLKWILPCSALLISHKINELKSKGHFISFVEPEDENARTYLAAVGFPLGGGKSKTTYMPIHHFLNGEKNSTKIIDAEINEVFEVIRRNFPKESWNPIFYLLGELSDNIDQHSKYTVGSIMVQFYKKKGFIDIGVLDNGITIPGAYEKNKIQFSDDRDALVKALRGISTKEGEMGRGKGLGTSNKLVEKGLEGEFYIFSRKGLFINKGKEESAGNDLKLPLNGTLVYSRFMAPKKNLNIYEYVE